MTNTKTRLTRRRLLQGAGVAAAATAMPHVWIPREVKAETLPGVGERDPTVPGGTNHGLGDDRRPQGKGGPFFAPGVRKSR